MDFIHADPTGFRQAAKRAKWKVIGPNRGFLVQERIEWGPSRICSTAGAAKMTAIDAISACDGRYGVILWVAAKDVQKALLGVSAASAATVET